MFVTDKTWLSRVALYTQSGHRFQYKSMDDLINSLGVSSFWHFRKWYEANVGRAYRLYDIGEVTPFGVVRSYSEYPYVLRAASGEFISYQTALQNISVLPRRKYQKAVEPAMGMPVPCTGRWRRGNAYRRPRTHQELRVIAGQMPDEPAPRAKRRKLPTSRDDIFVHSVRRNWKAYRRHQWKA